MVMRPAPGTDLAPKACLFGACDANGHVALNNGCGLTDWLVKNAGHLDWPVSAFAEQGERRNSREGADFMEHRRSAIMEKVFDLVQSRGGQFLEDAKAEGLRAGRVHAIEDGVRSAAFHPSSSALRGMAEAGFCLLNAGETLRALQASRQVKI
jgi:hypothetical protein